MQIQVIKIKLTSMKEANANHYEPMSIQGQAHVRSFWNMMCEPLATEFPASMMASQHYRFKGKASLLMSKFFQWKITIFVCLISIQVRQMNEMLMGHILACPSQVNQIVKVLGRTSQAMHVAIKAIARICHLEGTHVWCHNYANDNNPYLMDGCRGQESNYYS